MANFDEDLFGSSELSKTGRKNTGFGNVRLSEYLNAIQTIIKLSFDEATWVKAEIISMSSKAGHYYFELAEKDQFTDKTIATCRATLWRGQAQRIISQFKAESGIDLAKNLSVLVKVRPNFNPQYGFSLNIEDIDSSYTLGDLAQKYQDIVRQLVDEQLIDLNRNLPNPFDIRHVLVIAPEKAAGLGDFKKDADLLAQHGVCEFTYAHATFQGIDAPKTIQKALFDGLQDWQDNQQRLPDLIVIIRGGGAVNDLAYLNNYMLAAMLAQSPVPIWVGIGHERDRTILDEIAHRSFDTPSKVISGIRNHIMSVTEQAKSYFDTIQTIANYAFNAEIAEIDTLMALTRRSSKYKLMQLDQQADQLIDTHRYLAQQQLKQANQQTEQLMRELLLQSPKQTLERGYAIVRVQGKPIRSIKDLQLMSNPSLDQTLIQIDMQDGQATAQLNTINFFE
ncbi:MAG: exodeoxyribonuclease VII large subunit [Moraxellaceae bacterium]|nr:MAG: exodeoxyribonuclease VII large subunit [Moraxellaceae bacterium]